MAAKKKRTGPAALLFQRERIRNHSRIRIHSKIGTQLALLLICLFQLTLWIHPSQLQAYGFGRIAPSLSISSRINGKEKIYKQNSDDFFDSFRKSNHQPTNEHHSTSLNFAPFDKPLDSNPFQTDQIVHTDPFSPLRSISSFSTKSLLVLMGQKGGSKADKQNRKPKKGDSAPSPSPSPTPSLSAPRVSNQINVPIRRQIRYGKINKQLREAAASGSAFRQTKKGNFVAVNGPGGAGPVKRTSYRKSLDEETIQQKALERQRKGQDPDWSVVLNQTKADPLVLVDGYNVIYKWARLKKHMVRGDTDRARQLLLEDLEGLASLQRWRIECVFDGAGRAGIASPLGSGPGNVNSNSNMGTHPTLAPFGKTGTVRTVFTGKNIEADTYIEGRCAAAKNVTMGLTTSSLIVATDDSQIKLVANSAGALCMSSDRFVLELKAVKKGMQYRVEKAMSEVNNEPMRHESQWGAPNPASGNFFGGAASIGTKSSDDYKNKPKREVVQENQDGSKLVMARYGANQLLIKDNRDKKPKVRKADAVAKKKKKKKKKK